MSFLRLCVAQVIIRPAAFEADGEQVMSLFREYFEWVKSEQGIDLGFQNIEAKLKSLPGAFSPPEGCLLLAGIDGQVAGCVALRSLDAGICEMKRMYVRPAFRGKGIGRALGGQVIREARSRGYRLMRLDTADTMKAAQELYNSLGFERTQPYYELPPDILERAVFMELALR